MGKKAWLLPLAALAGGLAWWLWSTGRDPLLELEQVYTTPLEHPSHVLELHGEFVATELYTGRLAFSRSLDFQTVRYLDPARFQQRLEAPHFLAGRDTGGYLVSEGWGSGVVAIRDSTGEGWQRIQGGDGLRLEWPHGICVDSQGWIHVADSFNSRLVRFRAGDDGEWQIFPDHAGLIDYGRQILCREDGLWLANSYWRLNPGTGSNVLRIVDFTAGDAEVVVSFPGVFATGLEIIDNRWLVVGLWSTRRRLQVLDLATGRRQQLRRAPPELGAPYGMYFDRTERRLIVAHVGNIDDKPHPGGIAVYRAPPAVVAEALD